jgi:hypothetical protein
MLSQIQEDIGRELDRLKQRDESIGRLLLRGASSSDEAAADGGDHVDGGNRRVVDDTHESVAIANRVWNESSSSSSSSNVSPLMARDSSSVAFEDTTIGRPMPLSSPTGRISSLMMARPPPSALVHNDTSIIRTNNPNNRYSPPSNYYYDAQKKTDDSYINSTLVQKYRHFLIRHEASLGIFERLMENFEYYILFRYNNGLHIEIYYSLWNIIRWMNDVVLYGWGVGMGTLLGTRDELLLRIGNKTSNNGKDNDGLLSSRRIDWIVRMLRAALTATSCIHPALDAWCYHSLRFHNTRYLGTPPQRAVSYDADHHERREEMELIGGGKARAAYMSYQLERVKFVARMTLLAISWWTQHQRRRRKILLNNNEENNATIMHEKSNWNCNSSTLIFPILRGGGELDPHECVTSLKDMDDEMKVTNYVGKRTGRRSVARTYTSAQCTTLSCCQPSTTLPSLDCWLLKLMTLENRILYIHAIGEFLHILRPLYWSRETSKWRSSNATLSTTSTHHQQSYPIWKAWFMSLLMDLISNKLLHTNSISMDSTPSGHTAREEGGKSQTCMLPTSSFEQTKLEQLKTRQRRHRLYLLRSPMYDTITQPLAIFLGKVVSYVPSFGLGRWASEYVLDMMNYWSENHYMLEM